MFLVFVIYSHAFYMFLAIMFVLHKLHGAGSWRHVHLLMFIKSRSGGRLGLKAGPLLKVLNPTNGEDQFHRGRFSWKKNGDTKNMYFQPRNRILHQILPIYSNFEFYRSARRSKYHEIDMLDVFQYVHGVRKWFLVMRCIDSIKFYLSCLRRSALFARSHGQLLSKPRFKIHCSWFVSWERCSLRSLRRGSFSSSCALKFSVRFFCVLAYSTNFLTSSIERFL